VSRNLRLDRLPSPASAASSRSTFSINFNL
jgi:hypothetical protein